MNDDRQDAPKTISVRACVICKKPAQEKYRPFCSKRCADVDLHRWLSGKYAIPSTPDSDEDGDSSEDEARRHELEE